MDEDIQQRLSDARAEMWRRLVGPAVAVALRDLASWALAHTPEEIHAEALRRANEVDP